MEKELKVFPASRWPIVQNMMILEPAYSHFAAN